MENNQQPNFEGEEMKMPVQAPSGDTANEIPTEHKGPIIIVLFVALAALLGGILYWYSLEENIIAQEETSRPTAETNKEPESTGAYAQVESFGVMSTSDEMSAIEADLESTNLETLETEMNQIDAELEASFEPQQ